jgi:hypothetical protein
MAAAHAAAGITTDSILPTSASDCDADSDDGLVEVPEKPEGLILKSSSRS